MIRSNTRIKRLAACASAATMALSATTIPAGTATAASASSNTTDNTIVLSVGESRVINLKARMSDVVVANPQVVDVHVRSQTQLFIMAKGPGESNVYATGTDGKILYSGRVRVGNNLTSVDQMLKLAMPEADITVSNMNGMTLLTGTIKEPEDAAEAERLVQAFVGKDVTVVSRLRTATPLQVNLQVKFSEVSRNVGQKIGTNFLSKDSSGGKWLGNIGGGSRPFVSYNSEKNIWSFSNPIDGSYSLGGVAHLLGMDIAAALDLAESAGLATTLAQPNLTSLPGETASFLAGGEYPYQVDSGNNVTTIEFKQYGVQLAFTPTVLADGRISLRVRPTVSSLDFSYSSTIPALKSRTAETTVELGSGQAFMIAGLLSNDTANNVNKVPGLGNLPILGSLFKSRNFQRNETELVIVVTPYLVKPVNTSQIHLPTDGFRNADEMQSLLLQQGEDGVSGKKEPMPSIAPAPAPADPASAAPQPQASTKDRPRKSKPAKAAANSAPMPGFSF